MPTGQRPYRPRPSAGFTLIEIAVVLVIVALITAGILAITTSALKSTKSRVAAENANIVEQSLQRFIERYGRLPCPSVPGVASTGLEDVAGCTNTLVGATGIARGIVPWKTLGLPTEQVLDGYTNMFTYNVTVTATQTTAATVAAMRGNMTVHSNVPVALGTGGNQLNACAAGDDANACNMRAVVVLLSHGENGYGAYTSQGGQIPAPTDAAEVENTNSDTAFVKGEQTTTGYDDVVFAWSPGDLLDPLTRQGSIRAAAAVTNDSLNTTAVAISNFMVNAVVAPNNYPVPGASPVVLPNDAWGNALVYNAPSAGAQLCSLGPTAAVFTLTSRGIDGVQGLNATTGRNDDASITVTVDLLRSQVNNRPGMSC